ncbi:MAG: hypothetical protein EOO47_05950 [Flavobacterium sp.]|nr:MAG: hypothetical protein EOO47_05950 [Flavobacterium sp.]
MKKYLTLLVLALIQLSAIAQKANIKHFSFLAGGWEMKTKTGKIVERWQKHQDSLTGSSHKYNVKGDSILTETIVLKKIDGVWHFCVTGYEKGNEGKTNFKLISTSNNTFTFENKAHDFPQQIVYQNKGKTELLAWIEGEIGDKKRKMEFPYFRIK